MRATGNVLSRVEVPGEASRLVAARKLEVSAPLPSWMAPAEPESMWMMFLPFASVVIDAVTPVVAVCALIAAMTSLSDWVVGSTVIVALPWGVFMVKVPAVTGVPKLEALRKDVASRAPVSAVPVSEVPVAIWATSIVKLPGTASGVAAAETPSPVTVAVLATRRRGP